MYFIDESMYCTDILCFMSRAVLILEPPCLQALPAEIRPGSARPNVDPIVDDGSKYIKPQVVEIT